MESVRVGALELELERGRPASGGIQKTALKRRNGTWAKAELFYNFIIIIYYLLLFIIIIYYFIGYYFIHLIFIITFILYSEK